MNSIGADPADRGRAAARASIGSLMSVATTRPAGPTAVAASLAAGLSPLATSSTDYPGCRCAWPTSARAHGSRSACSTNLS